ncbi:MAG: tRNA (adenosine(37)-N6)-threonylcarbamoyltransferase complex ATPase subunit type 1 TsaE [Alphaproteobacteria bacterium]
MRLTLALSDESATLRFARRLAALAAVGDVLALSGDLGMGKSVLARAFIRARAGDEGLTVPSPTFTLVQAYELAGGPVWHVDAYRLADAGEAAELGLDEAFATAITLVEWPERIAGLIPAHALRLRLEDGPDAGARVLIIDAPDDWAARATALAGDDGD